MLQNGLVWTNCQMQSTSPFKLKVWAVDYVFSNQLRAQKSLFWPHNYKSTWCTLTWPSMWPYCTQGNYFHIILHTCFYTCYCTVDICHHLKCDIMYRLTGILHMYMYTSHVYEAGAAMAAPLFSSSKATPCRHTYNSHAYLISNEIAISW